MIVVKGVAVECEDMYSLSVNDEELFPSYPLKNKGDRSMHFDTVPLKHTPLYNHKLFKGTHFSNVKKISQLRRKGTQ